MAHHHQQLITAVGESRRQGGQEHIRIGRSGGVHQQCRTGLAIGCRASLKQKTVGGAAALQGVFQLEAEPLRAEAAQAHQPGADGQGDHVPLAGGCGRR